MMKSILQYFKPIRKEEKKEDIALPAPHRPLSIQVLPGAIEAANERALSKLQNLLPASSTSDANTSRSNWGNYMKVSDTQQFAIAK